MNGCRIRRYSAPRELCHFSYIGRHAVSSQRGLQTAVERTVALSSSPHKLSWRCLRQYVQHHCLAWWRFQFWSRCIQAELLQTTKRLLQAIDRRLSVSIAGEPACSTKGHVMDAWILRFQRRSRPCGCSSPVTGPVAEKRLSARHRCYLE